MQTLAEKEGVALSNGKVEGVAASDSWVELGPNAKGGRIRALAIVNSGGNKLAFAGGISGGLWKCENIAAAIPSWRRVNDYFDNLNISSIVIHPTNANIMFFGTGEGWLNPVLNGNEPKPISLKGGGVWRSVDKGATWTRLTSTTGQDFSYIQRMIIDASGYLWAGTLTGLYRSNVIGASAGGAVGATQISAWTEMLGANAPVKSVADIEIAKNSNGTQAAIFVSTGIDNEQGNVYRTTNNGSTWDGLSGGGFFGNGRIELATTPNNPNILFSCQNLTLARMDFALSTGTWNTLVIPNNMISEAWYHNTLIVSPATVANIDKDSIILYAGYVDIWKRRNNIWTKISDEAGASPIHVDQHLFVFEPNSSSKMYICNDGGVYRCDNITQTTPTYLEINNNLFITQFYTCATLHNKRAYLGGTQDNATQFFDVSGLTGASEKGTGDGAFCHFGDTITQYIAADQYEAIRAYYNSSNYVDYNDNASLNPNAPNNNPDWLKITPTELDRANKILYISGANDEIFRITDVFNPAGGVIHKFTVSQMVGTRASFLKLSPNDPTILYVGTTGGRLLCIPNVNTTSSTTPSGVDLHSSSACPQISLYNSFAKM